MEPAGAVGTTWEPRAGRLLVAAPSLLDPSFVRTVVLLLEVNDEGCLGVVVNRPGSIDVVDVLEAWGDAVGSPAVLFDGGPVSRSAALGLATLADPDAGEPPVGWRRLFDGCGLVDLDAPVEVVAPALRAMRIYAGYAGWGAGQLEDEIAEGAWFVVPGRVGDQVPVRPESMWRDVLLRQPVPLCWLASYPEDPSHN